MSKPLSVADPRSPATVAAYLTYFIFGLAVGPGRYVSLSISEILPPWSENVWAYSLLGGGLLFLIGALLKRKLYWALTLQASGSAAVGFGLLTYGLAIFLRSGYPNGVPFLIFTLGLAVASFLRCAACLRDCGKLTRLTAQSDTVQIAAEPEAHGDDR